MDYNNAKIYEYHTGRGFCILCQDFGKHKLTNIPCLKYTDKELQKNPYSFEKVNCPIRKRNLKK